MSRVAAYVPDLMDRSRLAGVGDVTFVDQPSGLASLEADVVVVDLTRPGVLEALPTVAQGGSRIIGFANHTRRDLLEAAHAAGCSEVMARSAFFSRLPGLLGG